MKSVDELRPQLVINVIDNKSGLLGYLVIDRTINGRASGGIRFAPDLILDEVANLAREMTLKYGFLNIPCGGAKAGIRAIPLTGAERKQIFLGFGRSLGPLLMSGIYGPGTDMGTSPEDMYYFFTGAGRKVQQKTFQNIEIDHSSALTVFVAAEKFVDYSGLSLPNCSVAIEGFGKLGISVSKLFVNAGAKVVAISTIEGAIYNHKGLDIDELIVLKEKFGDKLITNYQKAEVITKEELLIIDVDILVPCARPDTLNLVNTPQLRAKIIVSGANVAASEEAENLMFEKGIYYVPGYVSNCGEVLKHFLWGHGFNENDIHKIIKERFGEKIRNLIKTSHERSISTSQVAREISIENLRRMDELNAGHFVDNVLFNRLKRLSLSNNLPYKVVLLLRWFLKSMAASSVDAIMPECREGS